MSDVVANATVRAGSRVALPNGTVVLVKSDANQDACKGALLTLALTSTAGSGTASGRVGLSSGILTLSGTTTAGLLPGGQVTEVLSVHNSGRSNLYVRAVHLDAVSIDAEHAGCAASNFSMADVVEDVEIPPSSSPV